MKHDAYHLRSDPEPHSCAVFSSPHSGAEYSDAFLEDSCLSPLQLRSSEDAFVDLFCENTLGAPVLAARMPRAFVDLNRAADELDPAIVSGASGRATNRRIAAGLGVIPRVVANGRAIRLGKISIEEATARLNGYYHPYHKALTGLIEAQKRRFGVCYLFDLHSMPAAAQPRGPFVRRSEIILGDRYGTSCDPWLSDAVAGVFKAAGFRVSRNAPFAGGYITRHYGAPDSGISALQIEFDRSLYMDEESVSLRADFANFRARIAAVLAELAALPPVVRSLAAE